MLQFNGLKIKGFKELIQAGGILFLASIFANICFLLFWLFMVRRLSSVEYGVLNTLFSLLMILLLPTSTIQTVITKFVSQFYALRDFVGIKYFTIHFAKRISLADVLFLALFIIISPALGSFLKIPINLIIVTGIILFISIISPLTLGILQGAQRFLSLSVNIIIGSFLRLILAVSLVFVGFKVMGALVGVALSTGLALIISFFQIPQEILEARGNSSKQIRIDSVYQYSLPVFFSLLGWLVLTNIDVILVKHYFLPIEAGFYSVAQMVGKIILFLPSIISVVLFPKMSEATVKQRQVLPLLKKGLILTAFLCITASIFCILYPNLVLKILTRKQDWESIKLVPFFCIAMTFYALVNQFIFYNLAIQSYRFTIYILIASLLQIGLISLFHPNLAAVLFSLILCSALLFVLGFFELVITQKK
ncbi:MAG: oligosaccharide flippase family protein [Candidatus Omnitrophota bacterium]|nr:oligosaccharide flippase family protein [Candidatus Omnitrophota bacterium]